MFSDPLTQWAFTCTFGALAIHSALRIYFDRSRWTLVVGHILHAAMSLDMIAMAWPWWERIDWLSQMILFAVATLWFLALWMLGANHKETYRRLVGTHPSWHQAMHALMMGAMTWMVAVMSPGDHGSTHAHAITTGEARLGVALTAALLLAGAVTAVDASRRLGRGDRTVSGKAVENAASSVMNLGMAAMCALMLAM